ncbi:hypothetical protein AVEN_65685-1 [Araneus ventricosus]|uniref:Uncharacterized protein n=1 Tax=Araneus ventricosus TaxID=182803 RepID=A0A4Y2U9I1_ARAVE|nr:hypothetical protein AVEN_65685-1 [Araneus ventricosus]
MSALYRYYAYGLPSDIVTATEVVGPAYRLSPLAGSPSSENSSRRKLYHRCCQERSLGYLLKAVRHASPFPHSLPNLRGSPRDVGEKTPSVFTAFSFFQCQKRSECPTANKILLTPKKGPLYEASNFPFLPEMGHSVGEDIRRQPPTMEGVNDPHHTKLPEVAKSTLSDIYFRLSFRILQSF